MQLENVSLIVGLDWAHRTQTCCLCWPNGQNIGWVQVGAVPEQFEPWLEQLRRDCPPGQIVVALERPDGAVVELLRAQPGPGWSSWRSTR